MSSMDDMQRFMDAFPELRAKGLAVSKHVALTSEMTAAIETRREWVGDAPCCCCCCCSSSFAAAQRAVLAFWLSSHAAAAFFIFATPRHAPLPTARRRPPQT